MTYHHYQKCIEACLHCATLCDHCASSCLQEKNVQEMTHCIQLDMECAAICYTAARLMSLGSDKVEEYCRLCATICNECAEECRMHNNEHCQECAKACMQCADMCMEIAV